MVWPFCCCQRNNDKRSEEEEATTKGGWFGVNSDNSATLALGLGWVGSGGRISAADILMPGHCMTDNGRLKREEEGRRRRQDEQHGMGHKKRKRERERKEEMKFQGKRKEETRDGILSCAWQSCNTSLVCFTRAAAAEGQLFFSNSNSCVFTPLSFALTRT